MKILKYGEYYPKTCTCAKCKSELEYNIDDIMTFMSDCKNVDTNTIQRWQRTYIVCPVCKQTINLTKTPMYEYTPPCNSSAESTEKKRWWQR